MNSENWSGLLKNINSYSYRFFKEHEFECKCCLENQMKREFMIRLDIVRDIAGIPFVITSGYRCPKHNSKTGGKPDSAHVAGWAVDIACNTSANRTRIIQAASLVGISRVGINRDFVHLDCDPSKPSNVIWLY